MSSFSDKSLPFEYSLNSHYYKEIKPSLKLLIKKIYKLFNKKYSKMPSSYNMNIIENIIYNEKSHIVATFKDRLITDDTGEFLKRYYKKKESEIRLPKFYEYYDLYSKIFPNYTTFYEGKYLYQNIQRKQRMIDLQEQMEMEEENNRENIKFSKFDKEKVFNTDAIDSILNGTNNEGMEIIFNVNKNNIKQDEDIFNKEINNIIDVINDYENKNNYLHNKNKTSTTNNKNINYGNEVNKDNIWNKNISVPINLNYSKNKRLRNTNSMTIINNTNITYYNSIQSIMTKFFNISSLQKNGIINFNNNNNTNKNNKINSKSKYYQKKDKKLIQKLEQNLFKIRQKSIYLKNLSQNISTSNQTQKDISLSKRNSSAYTKKQSSSTSSVHNQKNKNKNINNSSSYKITNHNIIKKIMKNRNIDTGRKNSPLTSRNPPMNKLGLNLCQTKLKNIKNNINYGADNTSRNRYANNIVFHNKAKSTLRGSVFSSSSKAVEDRNNHSKSKNLLNNLKNKFNESKHGYKEISYTKRAKNKSCTKDKNTSNEMNKNSSINQYKNKNNSQPKTIVKKGIKYMSRNDSTLKVGILELVNSKKKYLKAFNISNFSKISNTSNLNSKNNFSKTHRSSFLLYNK